MSDSDEEFGVGPARPVSRRRRWSEAERLRIVAESMPMPLSSMRWPSLETMGDPGRIQVLQAIHDHLKDSFEFEVRCEPDAKGGGRLRVRDPIGRKSRHPRQPGA